MSAVPLKEVVEALNELAEHHRSVNLPNSAAYVDELSERIKQHGIAQADGMEPLLVIDCPDCNNDGAYYDIYGDIHQCQWCWEVQNSRFNYNKAVLAASPSSVPPLKSGET